MRDALLLYAHVASVADIRSVMCRACEPTTACVSRCVGQIALASLSVRAFDPNGSCVATLKCVPTLRKDVCVTFGACMRTGVLPRRVSRHQGAFASQGYTRVHIRLALSLLRFHRCTVARSLSYVHSISCSRWILARIRPGTRK